MTHRSLSRRFPCCCDTGAPCVPHGTGAPCVECGELLFAGSLNHRGECPECAAARRECEDAAEMEAELAADPQHAEFLDALAADALAAFVDGDALPWEP